jgi:hypothetical protein
MTAKRSQIIEDEEVFEQTHLKELGDLSLPSVMTRIFCGCHWTPYSVTKRASRGKGWKCKKFETLQVCLEACVHRLLFSGSQVKCTWPTFLNIVQRQMGLLGILVSRDKLI